MTRSRGERPTNDHDRSAAPRTRSHPRGARTIAASIRRDEWERVALLLLLALTDVVSAIPAGDIDDVLALLSAEESR